MSDSLTTIAVTEHSHLANHFTASGLVIAQKHVLLIHHKRIAAWLPPGGHLEAGELPHEAAVREVFEETGVAVEVISKPIPQTGKIENFFLPQPICMHAVQAVENQQSLYHLDIVFLCQLAAPSESLPPLSPAQEVHTARWVNLLDLDRLPVAKNVTELISLAKIELAKTEFDLAG